MLKHKTTLPYFFFKSLISSVKVSSQHRQMILIFYVADTITSWSAVSIWTRYLQIMKVTYLILVLLLLFQRWGNYVSMKLWSLTGPRWHISEYGATVEWYWQGKTKKLGKRPVPVPLYPPHIPHGVTWVRSWASMVRNWRLTASAMAWPILLFTAYQLFPPVHKTRKYLLVHIWDIR